MIELHMEQKTLEWHEARSGIVTGTSMKSATGKEGPQKTLMCHLIADRMAQQIHEDVTSAAMSHGNETEDLAVQVASEALGLKFESLGMILSSEIEGAGMSPDGVCRNADGVIVGGIEVKCPNSKKHVQTIMDGVVPAEHWDQFLSPFILSDEIEWWIFMSYDYRCYSRQTFFVHVDRETVLDEVMKKRDKLSKFLKLVDDTHFDLSLDPTASDVTIMKPKEEAKK